MGFHKAEKRAKGIPGRRNHRYRISVKKKVLFKKCILFHFSETTRFQLLVGGDWCFALIQPALSLGLHRAPAPRVAPGYTTPSLLHILPSHQQPHSPLAVAPPPSAEPLWSAQTVPQLPAAQITSLQTHLRQLSLLDKLNPEEGWAGQGRREHMEPITLGAQHPLLEFLRGVTVSAEALGEQEVYYSRKNTEFGGR